MSDVGGTYLSDASTDQSQRRLATTRGHVCAGGFRRLGANVLMRFTEENTGRTKRRLAVHTSVQDNPHRCEGLCAVLLRCHFVELAGFLLFPHVSRSRFYSFSKPESRKSRAGTTYVYTLHVNGDGGRKYYCATHTNVFVRHVEVGGGGWGGK